jgi:hypothetical protein
LLSIFSADISPIADDIARSARTGALCVVAAMFLILELSTPFSGPMRVSDGSVRYAISRIGQ